VPLLNIILKIGQKAKQKYFLAPNISEIKANPFTDNMEIKRINFNIDLKTSFVASFWFHRLMQLLEQ
jgi:hypothetical protein